MDPTAPIGSSAVAAPAPHLAKADEEFKKESGKLAAGEMSALYQALKAQFKNKPAAKERWPICKPSRITSVHGQPIVTGGCSYRTQAVSEPLGGLR
jgi:hypothetical protein